MDTLVELAETCVDDVAADAPTEESEEGTIPEAVSGRWALAPAEDAALLMKDQCRALQDCMGHLRKDARDLLMGFYRERHSCQELATRFNRSINAVRLTLSRVRRKLRDCVVRKMAVSGA